MPDFWQSRYSQQTSEADDPAELQINGETFGAVYKDEDEGELANIQMTVLSEDLNRPLLFVKSG